MTVKLLAYGPSASAGRLAKALGIKRLRIENSGFLARSSSVIINWGNRNGVTRGIPGRYINLPDSVRCASSKLLSLQRMNEAGVNVPQFTTDPTVAKEWLEKRRVVARKLDRGSSGRGIVLMSCLDDMVFAPLYTKYVPKYDEYRVHVMDGRVIDIQQKLRRHGGTFNNQIRTFSQGWIYARSDCDPPPQVVEASLLAVDALDLDFGAVDVGWTRKKERATVYEVNTAPGLVGTTLEVYRVALRRFIRTIYY